jgi:hypothetical protein
MPVCQLCGEFSSKSKSVENRVVFICFKHCRQPYNKHSDQSMLPAVRWHGYLWLSINQAAVGQLAVWGTTSRAPPSWNVRDLSGSGTLQHCNAVRLLVLTPCGSSLKSHSPTEQISTWIYIKLHNFMLTFHWPLPRMARFNAKLQVTWQWQAGSPVQITRFSSTEQNLDEIASFDLIGTKYEWTELENGNSSLYWVVLQKT